MVLANVCMSFTRVVRSRVVQSRAAILRSAADGFVFACADVRLHAAVGVGSLGLGHALRLLPQRRLLRIRQSWERRAADANDALRTLSLQGHHQDRRTPHGRVRHILPLT
jgi:hypothetical protein